MFAFNASIIISTWQALWLEPHHFSSWEGNNPGTDYRWMQLSHSWREPEICSLSLYYWLAPALTTTSILDRAPQPSIGLLMVHVRIVQLTFYLLVLFIVLNKALHSQFKVAVEMTSAQSMSRFYLSKRQLRNLKRHSTQALKTRIYLLCYFKRKLREGFRQS